MSGSDEEQDYYEDEDEDDLCIERPFRRSQSYFFYIFNASTTMVNLTTTL